MKPLDPEYLFKTLIPRLSILVVFGTGYLSFNGYVYMLNEMSVEFHNTAVASIIAIISSLLIWIAWSSLFAAVESCDTPRSLRAIVAISVVIQIGVTFVSSSPNVVGIGGEQALHIHALREIARAESQLEALQRFDFSVRSLIPEIEMDEARFRARGEDEFQNGTETGSKGSGAVSGSRIGVADRLASLIQQLEKASGESDHLINQAQRLLERMRGVVKTTNDPRDAIEKMAPFADALRTIFVKIERRDVGGMIVRTLNTLPSEIDSRERYVKDPVVRQRQQTVIASIRDALANTTAMIEDHLDTLDAIKVDGSYELRRVTAMKATFLYFTDLIAMWAASLTIDWMMWLLMLIRIVQLRWVKKDVQARQRVLRMPLGTFLDAHYGSSVTRNTIIPPEMITALLEDHYGVSDDDQGDDQS